MERFYGTGEKSLEKNYPRQNEQDKTRELLHFSLHEWYNGYAKGCDAFP